MAHGVIVTENMAGTKLGKYLATVKAATDLDNGNLVVLGNGYTTADGVFVREYTTPATTSTIGTIAIVASEEVDKSDNAKPITEFYNKAGALCRVYVLTSGDEFAVTADAFTTSVTPTVGTSILEAAAAVKGSLVNSATSATKIADLFNIYTQNGVTFYAFRVA